MAERGNAMYQKHNPTLYIHWVIFPWTIFS